MNVFMKVTSLSIQVPFRGTGNTIRQTPVQFDIYQQGLTFKAIPELDEDQRRIGNIPEELVFSVENGKPFSEKGVREGNQHLIEDIWKRLEPLQGPGTSF
jgi:hypothetical protein